ncbi:DUF4238 domain-containing protein [Herbiconiux sp. VKM Ac-2851]|nr:DUF4238 domain-containing protein [Herbiconiux sp. VKM Ac-2851]
MYLRNFADGSGGIMLANRDDPGLTFKTSTRKAVAERGFYRIETEDLARDEDRVEHDPEAIENALSQVEGAIAASIKRLVEPGSTPDQTDWYRLIQFAALQTVRGRRWREDMVALATQAARTSILAELDDEHIRVWLVAQDLPAGPDDVAAFYESLQGSRFPRLIPPQAVLVQESLKMAFGDPATGDLGLQQFLAGKSVSLIRTSRVAVLTSDEPVCWWSPGDAPIGYATAQMVWVPLSPRLILQFRDPDFDPAAHGVPDVADYLAKFVNGLVAAQADRWIIHHPSDAPLADMQLPARELWGDELVAERDEEDGTRRELFVHRRLRPQE